ncbi:hypothetical protein HDU82_004494 [Entophlyctis luteolus]|nr:hypothetical protein HDU82_004494 [Entophlyctis luteolus]
MPPIVIRRVNPGDTAEHDEMINLTRSAFFNGFQPGADEHYLLHILQTHKDFISELYMAAFIGEKPVACIAYSESKVEHEDGSATRTCTFGPVATHPAHQRKGFARRLIFESLEAARKLGYAACVILGDCRYYGNLGFRCAESFDVTDADGYYVPAMMVWMLRTEPLNAGRFVESDVFSNVSVEQADRWDLERGAPEWEKAYDTASQREHAVMVSLRYKKRASEIQ